MKSSTGRWVSGDDFFDRERPICGYWNRGFVTATMCS